MFLFYITLAARQKFGSLPGISRSRISLHANKQLSTIFLSFGGIGTQSKVYKSLQFSSLLSHSPSTIWLKCKSFVWESFFLICFFREPRVCERTEMRTIWTQRLGCWPACNHCLHAISQKNNHQKKFRAKGTHKFSSLNYLTHENQSCKSATLQKYSQTRGLHKL